MTARPENLIHDENIPIEDAWVVCPIDLLDSRIIVSVRGIIGGSDHSDNLFLYPERIAIATMIDRDNRVRNVNPDDPGRILDLLEGRIVCGSLEDPVLAPIHLFATSGELGLNPGIRV
jgi:hypothetical protein